jgi:hypothetical protein
MCRALLRFGAVVSLIPMRRGKLRVASYGLRVAKGQRRVTSLAVETGKLEIHDLGGIGGYLPSDERGGGVGCRQSMCSIHGRPEPQFCRGVGGPGTALRLASADPPRCTPHPSTTVASNRQTSRTTPRTAPRTTHGTAPQAASRADARADARADTRADAGRDTVQDTSR